MTNNKLKTLKDLENECISISEKVRDIKYSDQPKLLKTLKHFNIMVSIPPKNLRDAAREWIKELESDYNKIKSREDIEISNDEVNESLRGLCSGIDLTIIKNKIEWIQHFFNLEETE